MLTSTTLHAWNLNMQGEPKSLQNRLFLPRSLQTSNCLCCTWLAVRLNAPLRGWANGAVALLSLCHSLLCLVHHYSCDVLGYACGCLNCAVSYSKIAAMCEVGQQWETSRYSWQQWIHWRDSKARWKHARHSRRCILIYYYSYNIHI